MVRNVILTSRNVDNTSNNRFVFKFPSGSITFKKNRIALQYLSMYYSNFNITINYNNNSFGYRWVDGSDVVVNIPEGFYDVSALNLYLQSILFSNKHYLLDSFNRAVFPLSMSENSTYYSVQLNEIAFSATSGYTLPIGATWTLPLTLVCPQFNIFNNEFKNIIGFNAGFYPTIPQNSNQSQLSSFCPQVSPVSTFLVKCNLVNNGNIAIPNNLLYSFAPTVNFGSLIQVEPQHLDFLDILDGTYPQIVIDFIDQNFTSPKFQDPTMCIILTID